MNWLLSSLLIGSVVVVFVVTKIRHGNWLLAIGPVSLVWLGVEAAKGGRVGPQGFGLGVLLVLLSLWWMLDLWKKGGKE